MRGMKKKPHSLTWMEFCRKKILLRRYHSAAHNFFYVASASATLCHEGIQIHWDYMFFFFDWSLTVDRLAGEKNLNADWKLSDLFDNRFVYVWGAFTMQSFFVSNQNRPMIRKSDDRCVTRFRYQWTCQSFMTQWWILIKVINFI
jgi:hypothetical protein